MRQRQQTRQDATYRSRKSVQTTGASSPESVSAVFDTIAETVVPLVMLVPTTYIPTESKSVEKDRAVMLTVVAAVAVPSCAVIIPATCGEKPALILLRDK